MYKNQRVSYFYAILAVFFWSTVASAFKISLAYVSVAKLLFYASLTSSIVLLLINLIFKTFSLPSGKQILNSVFLGAINPFLYYLVLFAAYNLLPAQIAQPLNYTWPIVLSIFSVIFLNQRFHIKLLISILLGFAGVSILSFGTDFSGFSFNLLGIFLAISSAFIWASYWILNIKRNFSPVMGLFLNFVFGTIYSAILLFFMGENFFIPNLNSFFSLVYIGMFEMGVTFAVWFKALNLASNTTKVTNLIYISPFISLIFIHFVIGETIRITTVYGLILIIISILIQSFVSKKELL